ncbi:MAG: hypothetical protein IKT70_00860 [Clostridia bacterium]|nr:hypothetical protein [Clostridia bacterium]
MYKYELHLSTKDFAPKYSDAPSAEEVVENYLKAGYSGIVLTNPWGYQPFKRSDYIYKSPKQLTEEYLEGYYKLKNVAGKELDVFLGAEVTFKHCTNEYLVYGLTPEKLAEFDLSGIYSLKKIPDIFARIHALGDVLIYQAHPFMPYSRVVEEVYQLRPAVRPLEQRIDGMEVYIAKDEEKANHFLTKKWARDYNTPTISGSGYSSVGDRIAGGIATEEKIKDNSDLVKILSNEEYKLISGGEIQNV